MCVFPLSWCSYILDAPTHDAQKFKNAVHLLHVSVVKSEHGHRLHNMSDITHGCKTAKHMSQIVVRVKLSVFHLMRIKAQSLVPRESSLLSLQKTVSHSQIYLYIQSIIILCCSLFLRSF